jgi:hypothetical protein
MARRIIDIGIVGNDGTGDSIRDSFRKVNDNFRELYSSLGLGERLKFIELDDTPETYDGTLDTSQLNYAPLVTVNNTGDGLTFKQLRAGNGINIDFEGNPSEIIINSDFAEISADPSPQLGGDLSARFGGAQYRILDLGGNNPSSPQGQPDAPLRPIFQHEAVNKFYADTKISRAGINAIDPETGSPNPAFGRMTGPLLLSRDPEADDDILYDGRTAATKRYVDNSAFGSTINLYVATSGQDARSGITSALQGRALAYAYRTIEAACRRAEELVLEARDEIGPYKKTLTFNSSANDCTLAKIETSPTSGTGFVGVVRMSVETAVITTVGINYYPGDILEIVGGTPATATSRAKIEVLSTASLPGSIVTFRISSTGLYTTLPPSINCTTVIVNSAAPEGVLRTNTATFNLTFNVASVAIVFGGSGYNLVSVRITGGGGSGAFGTAVVSAGVITSLTITDRGTGFTSLPTLAVDLPRFFLRTDGFRTDFTGDVLTNTADAIRGRDIREGLFLLGETSGALAQIVSHSGALDSSGNEIFDVDVKFGAFQIGETIAYGDVAKNIQIAIIVEAGVYEENLPLRVPINTTILGDDFRRCIVRPKAGTSSSPWAFTKFRRDIFIGQAQGEYQVFDPIDNEWTGEVRSGDLIQLTTQLYGYHYLEDVSQPVYPPINNPGNYNAAAALLTLNRSFLSEEITAWMNRNISLAESSSVWFNFQYNEQLCKRDVGLLVDAFVFDLKYGSYNRTISAGLKYYQSSSALIAITTQLPQYLLVLAHLESLMLDIIANIEIVNVYNDSFSQIIDPAYAAEVGSAGVVTALLTALTDVIDGSGSVNYPKDNDRMDMFLANDATRWQSISGQGHGGFMMVLDPTGQILAKSPYPQECASFSKSRDRITFAGGMYVDGFTGNLQFRHTASSLGNTVISVAGLDRFPQLPASFIVLDQIYRVNTIRNFVYNPLGSTADFILDETAPFNVTPGAVNCTISVGSPAVITAVDHRLQSGAILYFSSTGTLPGGMSSNTEYYVTSDGLSNDTFNITTIAGSITKVNTTSAGTGTITFQRRYELIMPGNRSMVCNDFTQINDLGFGIVVNNGGLVEAVSMFTYYCHISFFAVGGGQIRSVSSSSAHGNYALVAQGFDPLEVPTPTTIFEDLAQSVYVFAPGGAYTAASGQKFIYVDGFDYIPNAGSELEIDHDGVVFRYPVVSASVDSAFTTVYRLNLTSGSGAVESTGLFAAVADDTKMTLRQNGQIILTGDLDEVAVRPSTGLKLRETEDTVYRVLQFSTYIDANGPYEVLISNASPTVIQMLATVTTIATNVCTTSQNHKLRVGDKFIPQSTSNNFVSGTIYYVISVPNYNQFTVSTSPGGGVFVLANGTGLTIKGVKTHRMLENYTMSFTALGGSLPTGITSGQVYFVVTSGLTDTQFSISATKNGIIVGTSSAGSGTFRLRHEGLTLTNLRENYDYVELTIWQRGEFTPDFPAGRTCTFTNTPPSDVVVGLTSHGFVADDVIGFTVSIGGALPTGISAAAHYFVLSSGLGTDDFKIASEIGGTPIVISDSGSGTFSVGKVTGRAGDSDFRIVPVAVTSRSRVANSKFMWKGEEYVITQYDSEAVTLAPYAKIYLNRSLVNAVNNTDNVLTLKSAVATRTNGAIGTLTIRISLTRVTGHDLLEIGTGSYADTNYPKEIYGASVNALNEANEVEERDVGRVFYVTTDQFGNFNVGPYFKVDQGTGQVTFSSSIALSNLDGIGFKRGVPVSEFSTDDGMGDAATDTVPTENAVVGYVDRRLGINRDGTEVIANNLLIPVNSGGFMPLTPLPGVAMKGDMNLGNNKITNLADPVSVTDAMNLRSFTLTNLQGLDLNEVDAGDILVFTGPAGNVVNATITGDIRFGSIEPGVDSTLKIVDAQIVAGSIINADVNASAAISQSKLAMNAATTRANATGISQADRGLASFNSAQFTITDGWVTLATNGVPLTALPQLAPDTVLGNSGITTANVAAVTFSTVVDEGLGVKKAQYSSTGFLRRTSAASGASDANYTVIEAASGSAANPEGGKLIERTGDGDFGARIADLGQLKIDGNVSIDSSTTNTGGTISYLGFGAVRGISIGAGSLGTDRISNYFNNTHRFRTQEDNNFAPIICSSIETLALTTGSNITAGTITGRWTLTGTSPSESRLQATYSADLAENYEGDREYAVGTVLVFGGDKEVTTTTQQGDTRVAGVVSNTAAFTMYEACPGLKNLVALQGRVPCKVVGKIKKGDILITSRIEGVAIAATGDVRVGTVVGKALEEYDSDHIGTIEIAVGRT